MSQYSFNSGTHSITNATVSVFNNGFRLSTTYTADSSRKGALYCFLFTKNLTIDFEKSVYLTVESNFLEKNNVLSPGNYQVLVYDTTDGKLHTGDNYPAFNLTLDKKNGLLPGMSAVKLATIETLL